MLGLPIIVAKDTGVDQLVSTHEVGVVCDYSAGSFEQAADRLFADAGELAAIQRRARTLFETTFSWEIMEQRLLSIYRSIL
jgi:glycosyltransferase involved in cell wall biosynthesis